ncbi:hypothetical protein TNCV_636021 [Trichonephila clavipes]|nr:hypothetical protein TNCV_636021 [Trichonephila clavipes]
MCRSKGGNQRKASLSSANNFMVIHPGQTIIDKNIATDHDVVGDETENNSANPQTLIARVHYFVREEDSLATARVQVQSISPSSSGRVTRFLGGGQTGCAAPKAVRVGVESTKKPTPDVVVFEK